MQPTLCSKCKKNVAVVFISRQNEKGEMVNEGLCLKCAAQLGLPQVEEMMKRMGISPEDLENINNEMMQAFGGAEELSDMPGINHLYLVDPFQYHRGVLLGRASHPVDAVGQGACAVRLDTDLFPRLT